MKLLDKLMPTGKESAGAHVLKLISIILSIYLSMFVVGFALALAGEQLGWIEPRPKAYYDPNDPKCTGSNGQRIVWINDDNWIEVQGTDQEKIAELVADGFSRREKQ